MAVYPKLTVAAHVALGNRLKVTHGAISEVLTNFPKTSRPGRAARRLQQALMALKGALDTEVCAMVPRESDPRGLALHVYYGKPFVPHQTTDPMDAFGPWTIERSVDAEGDQAKLIRLSVQDQQRVAEAILHPPEPTPALRRAFKLRGKIFVT